MVEVGMDSVLLENLQLKFNNFVKKPENYLKVQNKVAEDLKCLVKSLYDLTKAAETGPGAPEALEALEVEGLDEEQIWQQLELQNEVCTQLVQDAAGLIARKTKLLFLFPHREEPASQDSHPQGSHDEQHEGEEEDGSKKVKKKKRKKTEASEVDDKFFKLREMEDFLVQQEKGTSSKDAEKDDELIDYFEDVPSDSEDEEGEQLHYADFFDRQDSEAEGTVSSDSSEEGADDAQNGDEKRVRFVTPEPQSEVSSEAEDDAPEPHVNGPKSSLERRQLKLAAQISKLEDEALAEKPWQLKGEVTSTTRPQNSLLEETVEFDMVSKPAPVRTEKTTLRLEDIIKERIKDRAWDDVERKVRPVETIAEYKKRLVLDQEKSKISLAEVYEREYLQQKQVLETKDADAPEEEPPENEIIRQAMAKLFRKLDALSNFHYTPKPAIPEVKIISNLPAITVEEVAPVATSDTMLLAPEEIKAKQKGELMAQEERDDTDKKRQRRWKKAAQRKQQRERENRAKVVEKLRPGLGNPYSKEKALREVEAGLKTGAIHKVENRGRDKSVKSSAAFFNSLQEEVDNHMRVKKRSTDPGGKERVISAKKLKL